MIRSLAAILATILAGLASAQDSREEYEAFVQDRLAESSVIADGAISPELVPFGEKLAATFRLYRARLEEVGTATFVDDFMARYGGSKADAERVADYVASDAQFRQDVRDEERNSLEEVCLTLLDTENASGYYYEVASAFSDIEDSRLARLTEHYREVLDELDAGTRARMLSATDVNVVPRLTYGRVDYKRLAVEAPEFFQEWSRSGCERASDADARDESEEGLPYQGSSLDEIASP